MTINRKIKHSISKDLSFYITGAVLTAITVMLLIGAFAVSDTLTLTFEEYFEKTHIEGAEFTTDILIPTEAVNELENTYHVIIEPQKYFEVIRQDSRMRVFLETDKINVYTIREGRKAQEKDEIAVTYNYAKEHGIQVGDILTLGGKAYTITGLCMKPDYAVMLYDFNAIIADNYGFGIGGREETNTF